MECCYRERFYNVIHTRLGTLLFSSMHSPSSWRSPPGPWTFCSCHKIFWGKHGKILFMFLFLTGIYLCSILTTKWPLTDFSHVLPNSPSESLLGEYSGVSAWKSVVGRIPLAKQTFFGPDLEWESFLEVSNTEFIFDLAWNVGMKQDNPLLLLILRKHYLLPPLPLHYNLENPRDDPAKIQGQPEEILRILKNMTNGVFVEAGANNGEYLSTTLRLERDYGWTGLLVEPDSRAFSELRTKGRRSWLTHSCLSVTGKPEKVTFMKHKYSALSKMEKVSDHHKEWIKPNITRETVPCFPFYSLVSALNMTVIDYFSLDVEGAELQVLKTIPFDKILIRTLSVEFNKIARVKGQDRQLRELMKSNGYVLAKKIVKPKASDYIFAHFKTMDGYGASTVGPA